MEALNNFDEVIKLNNETAESKKSALARLAKKVKPYTEQEVYAKSIISKFTSNYKLVETKLTATDQYTNFLLDTTSPESQVKISIDYSIFHIEHIASGAKIFLEEHTVWNGWSASNRGFKMRLGGESSRMYTSAATVMTKIDEIAYERIRVKEKQEEYQSIETFDFSQFNPESIEETTVCLGGYSGNHWDKWKNPAPGRIITLHNGIRLTVYFSGGLVIQNIQYPTIVGTSIEKINKLNTLNF